MRGGRILWGQIAVVFTIVLVTTWAATQWTAWRLGFQAQLGNPWFELAGWPIYYPPALAWWWYAFDAYAPSIFVEGGIIAASGGIMSIVAAITMSIMRAREARNVATYGSARWAEDKEIRAAGLLGPDGVVLGRHEYTYLRHDGPEHVLCFAPTRSGKGVGLVVPTLLTWPGSAIIHDIKGENWTLTAGFRSRHGRVLLFDPTNAKSSAYNPLLEVRQGEWEVRDVQNIADILVDPEGSLDRRNHWEKTSHSLLVGAILHVLYAEADKTLAGVASFLSDPRRPVEATLRAMMETPHLGDAGVHPVIASSARELLNKSENERSGVTSRSTRTRPVARRAAAMPAAWPESGRRRGMPACMGGKTAFMAERVLGNVISSGIKVLVLAVIVGIGSTLFSQFTQGFGGQTPSIDDAMAVVLAALSLVGLGIFGPGIASGLVSGGPQLGAGAAVGTGLAVGGAALAAGGAAGLAAKGGAAAVRGGATAAGAASASYTLGSFGQSGAAGVAAGLGGVAHAAGNAATSPLRRAAASVKSSFAEGMKAGFGATGGTPPTGSADSSSTSTPAAGSSPSWAQRMRQGGHTGHAVQTAAHAVRSGDGHASGSSVNLSESDRT